MQTEAEKALSKTKIDVMSRPDCVFFAAVMLGMKHIFDDTMPTAYTTGYVCGYNTSFFLKQPPIKRGGLVLHETLHPVLMHVLPERRGDRDPKIWNMAGDYVINIMVKKCGFDIPDGGLYDMKYDGWFTEQVYDELVAQGVQPSKDFMEDIREGPDKGPGAAALKEHIDDLLIQAVMQARKTAEGAGSIPGSVEFYVNGLLEPIIPWHRILRFVTRALAKDDYSMRRPNKRFMPNYYLPSLFSEKVGEVAIGTDTSGSVTDDAYNHYVSETYAVLRTLRPDAIKFLQFDTTLKDPVTVRSVADFKKVKFTGRGGTDVLPLLKWAEENKPRVLVVFSDGDFGKHPKAHHNPGCPVIWIVHDNKNFTVPFGQVIPFNI